MTQRRISWVERARYASRWLGAGVNVAQAAEPLAKDTRTLAGIV